MIHTVSSKMRFLAVARLCFCKQKLPQNAKSAMRISLFLPLTSGCGTSDSSLPFLMKQNYETNKS